MFRIIIALTLTIGVVACGGNNTDRKDGFSDVAKTPEDSLFQQVMDGHDEAMAKMGKLKGYRKQVDQKLDSLQKTKKSSAGDLQKSYTDLKANLASAEDGMNKWMEEFQIDSAQDNTDVRIQYLTGEKVKVEAVRDQINSVIAQADSLLKK